MQLRRSATNARSANPVRPCYTKRRGIKNVLLASRHLGHAATQCRSRTDRLCAYALNKRGPSEGTRVYASCVTGCLGHFTLSACRVTVKSVTGSVTEPIREPKTECGGDGLTGMRTSRIRREEHKNPEFTPPYVFPPNCLIHNKEMVAMGGLEPPTPAL